MKALLALVVGVFLANASYAHDPSRTSAKNPSGQVYASPAQVRLVQERLRDQGRKPGAEGVWDERTIAEVRDFQKANGLAPTGELDTSLLSALKIGEVLAGETSALFLDGLLRAETNAADMTKGRGAAIYVSPAHIAQIQHVLRDQNYYAGTIDGAWGVDTARAANKFRQEHGLEAADGLDIALLRALNQHGTVVPKQVAVANLRTDGVPLLAGPTAIRALQRELAKTGQEPGAVDGVWGENTRQALRGFQREHGLEQTGTLTLPTLAALGIDVATKADVSAQERTATPDALAVDR